MRNDGKMQYYKVLQDKGEIGIYSPNESIIVLKYSSDNDEWLEDLCARLNDMHEIIERYTRGCILQSHEIEQVLGKALKYPWFKDDQKNFPDTTEEDGVCVGEHVPETLAAEAADRIKELTWLFDTQYKREMEVFKRWREEGKLAPLTMPDYGRTLVMLLDELEAAKTCSKGRHIWEATEEGHYNVHCICGEMSNTEGL